MCLETKAEGCGEDSSEKPELRLVKERVCFGEVKATFSRDKTKAPVTKHFATHKVSSTPRPKERQGRRADRHRG